MNNPIIPGSTGTIQDNLYCAPDDKTTVSRSKLEHLKDMADDDRIEEKFGLDNIVSIISQGIFFTSLGGTFSFSSLPLYGQILCGGGIVLGLFLGTYSWIKIASDRKNRERFRKKLAEKIDEIIKQMDNLAKIKQKNE